MAKGRWERGEEGKGKVRSRRWLQTKDDYGSLTAAAAAAGHGDTSGSNRKIKQRLRAAAEV